ncbi:MAG: DUF4382 domain-containing protein [Nitrospirae bacterium]|nr:DUF4382 domain-containing protein [Nitrospirota bacterium]
MSRTRMVPYFLITLVSMAVGFFLLTGCGKSSQTASSGSGTVGILLKDAHTVEVTDPLNGPLTISQLWVTINKISIHNEDEEEGWLTVYDSTAIDPGTGTAVGPKVYDLLTLHSSADLIALAEIPAGTYEKIRFELETAAGADYFCTGTDADPCADATRFDLTVPSGKVDLDLHPHLTLTEGSSTNLVFDFIPDRSIHITATGEGRFLLRPEIHAGIMGDPGFEEIELEEFEGTIETLQCNGIPPTLSLSHEHGGGLQEVDLSLALIYDSAGTQISCSDLSIGAEVEIKGTLQADGTLMADVVKSEGADDADDDRMRDDDSGHHGISGNGHGHHPEFRGTVSDLQLDGNGGATFTLLSMGGMTIFQITVDAATRIKDERSFDGDLLAGLSVLADGQSVKVEGTTDTTVSPALIAASEVEIKG